MICITVTGETYPVRKSLKDNHFRWNVGVKGWQKTVGEAGINAVLESIRPPVSWSDVPSPKITVTLHSVDCYGEKMHDGKVLRLNLRPAGERAGIDFFKLFLDEVCGVSVVANDGNTRPANAEADRIVRKQKSRGEFY